MLVRSRISAIASRTSSLLAEAGCTAPQIMAILGHKTLSEAERYTRDGDQQRLAEAAILR